jgi:hypothetical protein
MAKAYSFVDVPQPLNVVATPVAGGTLAVRTWYYTIQSRMGTHPTAVYAYNGKSLPSAEVSATTTAGNQSVQLVFEVPKGEAGAYIIFRSTSPGGYNDVYGAVALGSWPTDAANNVAGVVTWVDTGYAAVTNVFLETQDKAHGVLTISGSTIGDKFSIADLYAADVAAGWGVILKLDESTYRINTYLYCDGQHWEDIRKVIIFGDACYAATSYFTFGAKVDLTPYGGCTIIFKNSWFATLIFAELIAYDSTIKYEFSCSGTTYNRIGFAAMYFTAGTIENCLLSRFRSVVPGSYVNCLIKNTIYAVSDVTFGTGSSQFINVQALSGTRVFQTSTGSIIEARGIYAADGYTTYGVVLFIGKNAQVTFIDSIFLFPILASTLTTDSTGSWVKDCFSFNLTVFEHSSTTPIEAANVKIYDAESTLVVDGDTDSSGVLAEQIVVRQLATVDNLTVTTTQQGPFKLIISMAGYETYIEYFDPVDSSAIVKTVGLKTAIDIMPILGEGIALRVDPTNSAVDRDVLIKP